MIASEPVWVVSLCVVLACSETLNGIFRNAFLARRLGKARATKVSMLTGAALAFVICYLLVPRIGLTTLGGHLLLGVAISLFMACFDIAIGRLLMRRAWAKVAADFNPATGNLLVIGLALLVLFPGVVWLVRGGGG